MSKVETQPIDRREFYRDHFNQDGWDAFAGRWGGAMAGDISLGDAAIIIASLHAVIENFNSLMENPGARETIGVFVGQSEKVAQKMLGSGDLLMRVMAMIILAMVRVIKKGLAQGYLTEEDIKEYDGFKLQKPKGL